MGWNEASVMAMEEAEHLMRMRLLESPDCADPPNVENEGRPLDWAPRNGWNIFLKRHREVVELMFMERFSICRTGHALDISADSVGSRLHLVIAGSGLS